MSEICHKVHYLFSGLSQIEFPFDTGRIPQNGIYILYERGEFGHDGNRVVRVGTHTGNNRLLSRLNQHFVSADKDRSIFRKNIGRAILNRKRDVFLAQWEIDLTTRQNKEKYAGAIDSQRLQEIEKEVSDYIQQNFYFVIFRVNNKEERLHWEARIISTIAQCIECRPSNNWLGLNSPKAKIRDSGLWLINELYKEPLSKEECQTLKTIIAKG